MQCKFHCRSERRWYGYVWLEFGELFKEKYCNKPENWAQLCKKHDVNQYLNKLQIQFLVRANLGKYNYTIDDQVTENLSERFQQKKTLQFAP